MLLLLDYDRLSFIDIESLGGGFAVETSTVDGEPLSVVGRLLQIPDAVGLIAEVECEGVDRSGCRQTVCHQFLFQLEVGPAGVLLLSLFLS